MGHAHELESAVARPSGFPSRTLSGVSSRLPMPCMSSASMAEGVLARMLYQGHSSLELRGCRRAAVENESCGCLGVRRQSAFSVARSGPCARVRTPCTQVRRAAVPRPVAHVRGDEFGGADVWPAYPRPRRQLDLHLRRRERSLGRRRGFHDRRVRECAEQRFVRGEGQSQARQSRWGCDGEGGGGGRRYSFGAGELRVSVELTATVK